MGWYVHIHVSFACDDIEDVRPAAKKHIGNVADRDGVYFLQDIINEDLVRVGPKGGLLLWGYIGNHVHMEDFVEELKPFWGDILRTPGKPFNFDHIIVFYEEEGSEKAKCYEIYLSENSNKENNRELVIDHHILPFQWGQY